MTSKIIVTKPASYMPVEIWVGTLTARAKQLGWQCDVFPTGDVLHRFMLQNFPGQPKKFVDDVAMTLLASGEQVVRLLTPGYDIVYCPYFGFDMEAAANNWLKHYCRVYRYFQIELQLRDFARTFKGEYKDEVVSKIVEWLERK